jgi:hypothetical protein
MHWKSDKLCFSYRSSVPQLGMELYASVFFKYVCIYIDEMVHNHLMVLVYTAAKQ